jgi:two-component system sensor histidine kinase AlgZ
MRASNRTDEAPVNESTYAPCGPGTPRSRRIFAEQWPYLVVPVVLTLLFSSTHGVRDWRELLLSLLFNTIASTCIGVCLDAIFTWAVPRVNARLHAPALRVAVQGAAIATAVLVGTEVAVRILGLFPGLPPRGAMRADILRVGLVVGTIVMVVILTFGRLRAHAREVELRAERAQREALLAQLGALQARTNPHFLYNSLNTVASLIEEDPSRAELVLERLAALFRYALEGSSKSQVPLADELHAVRGYLEIETLRFGERLVSHVEVEPGLESVPVPPLILQPLVENAVLHGVASRRSGGAVTVRAGRENGSLVLCVEDDGPGPGASTHQGSRTSLSDLQSRLALVYGDAARLEAGAANSGGYRVRLVIPMQPTGAS